MTLEFDDPALVDALVIASCVGGVGLGVWFYLWLFGFLPLF